MRRAARAGKRGTQQPLDVCCIQHVHGASGQR
jgi:hypothetical protein